jgi:hypothetical protein
MQVPGCCSSAGLLSVELFSHVKACIDHNPVARAPPPERRPPQAWPIVVVGCGLPAQKMFLDFRLRLFVKFPHVGGVHLRFESAFALVEATDEPP